MVPLEVQERGKPLVVGGSHRRSRREGFCKEDYSNLEENSK